MLHLDLILKIVSDQSHAEEAQLLLVGLHFFFFFFGILVRPGTYLGQDFSDMLNVFLVFIVLFISLLLVYYFM